MYNMELINFLNECAPGTITPNILNEGADVETASKVIGNIIEKLSKKYAKIDFSMFEKTRGDATLFKHYEMLRKSIDLLCDIHNESDCVPAAVVLSTTLNNLVEYKEEFRFAFRTKNSLSILLYNTIYRALVDAVSYVITSALTYKKVDGAITVVTHNVPMDCSKIIKCLVKFNKEVADGNVADFFKASLNFERCAEEEPKVTNESISDTINTLSDIVSIFKDRSVDAGKIGTIIGIGAAISGLVNVAINIIPIIKTCIYAIFRFRHSVAEACKIQEEFILLNVEILKENNGDEKIIAKQEKIANLFNKIASAFALEYEKSERDSATDENNDPIDAAAIEI